MTSSRTQEIIEESRRECERSRRLCREVRESMAQSLVLMWQSRRWRDAAATSTTDLARRAEQAKRNRETVVHNGPPPGQRRP